MIAITFALRAESSEFVAQLADEKMIRQAVVLHTGVGQKKCQDKIEEFLRHSRPDFLISSGFAGGISQHLQTGDLICGENFSDRQLLSTAERILGSAVRPINILTTTEIIDSAAQRAEQARASRAAAVDMETEFIARACAARGIRMLSLRVISDSVRDPLPLPISILFNLEKQRTDPVKLSGHLLKHPTAILRLIRFSRQIARARSTLAQALMKLLQADSLGGKD